MSLQTDYNLSQDTPFRQRTAQALVKAARNIILENPAEPNHANRLAWANSISGTNAAYAMVDQKAMMWIVANPTISSTYANNGENSNAISDNDLEFVVNSEVLPRLIPA